MFPRSEINKISGEYEDPVVNMHVINDGIEINKHERGPRSKEVTVSALQLGIRYAAPRMVHRGKAGAYAGGLPGAKASGAGARVDAGGWVEGRSAAAGRGE